MFKAWIIAGLALAWGAAPAGAEELLPLEHVVVFNNNGRVPPTPNVYLLFRLSEKFALVEDFYTPATLDASLRERGGRGKPGIPRANDYNIVTLHSIVPCLEPSANITQGPPYVISPVKGEVHISQQVPQGCWKAPGISTSHAPRCR